MSTTAQIKVPSRPDNVDEKSYGEWTEVVRKAPRDHQVVLVEYPPWQHFYMIDGDKGKIFVSMGIVNNTTTGGVANWCLYGFMVPGKDAVRGAEAPRIMIKCDRAIPLPEHIGKTTQFRLTDGKA